MSTFHRCQTCIVLRIRTGQVFSTRSPNIHERRQHAFSHKRVHASHHGTSHPVWLSKNRRSSHKRILDDALFLGQDRGLTVLSRFFPGSRSRSMRRTWSRARPPVKRAAQSEGSSPGGENVSSSFLLLVVRPGAPSGVLAPSSDARSP